MQVQSGAEKYLPRILSKDKEYKGKVEDLFRAKANQNVSLKHQQRNIIINPSMFFNLLESNFLNATKKQSLELYYQLKMEVLAYLKYLLEDFPLNAKFIYEEAFLVVEQSGKVNFVTYLTKDIAQAFRYLQQSKENKQIYEQYIELCSSIFNLICMVCTLKTSELKLITNNLTQFYYEQKLSTQIIGHTFRLLDGGLQERTITPYLYFIDNNRNDSVKVLFSNNRWPFTKGMTLFMWVNALKQRNCQLLWLKTEDGNELVLKVEQGKVVIDGINRESQQKSSFQICEFPTNTVNMVGIELQPISEGLFRSTSYLLNVNINGKEYKNLTANIPKFESNEFVVQYSLLKNFIGNLYSIIITARPELSVFDQLSKFSQFGICSEALVWEFIDKKVLKIDSILCIFNAERYYQGLLLNYVHEKNHGCYEGRISSVKYHKYDDKIIEVFMPFLYLLTLVKEKDEKWMELFDLVLQYITSIVGKEKYETRSILYLLYFLEINKYQISQSTLNLLYEYNEQYDNFYLETVVKYLDVHFLTSKGLKISQNVEPFENPVEKRIFLFLLESEWKTTWNKLQGFEGWWSPLFFKAQKNQQYDPQIYLHNKDREGRVEWSVMNFVTPDYCKCLVQPEFVAPEYGNLDQFQKQYVQKECFRQEFKMRLYKVRKGQILICDKKSNSSFEIIKSKLLKVADKKELIPKKQKQQTQFKQFEAPCLFIDILTIVVGIVRITKDGFLVFSGKHDTKRFDHMCVKAFKNQYFVYFSVALSDVLKIYRKRFNATPNALFVKLKDGREIMLHLYEKNADAFLTVIGNTVDIKKQSLSNYLNGEEPYKWIDKYLSNYEYLQWLNEIAGRSYTDISQYPVIPWTYVSDEVKVVEKDNFRDLNKNMGMQGDSYRIRYFIEKYENKNEEQLFDQYHFGTHYSSSSIIFNFLIRIRPYSIGALTLQSGRFDVADRIFYSYCGSWNNAISSPTDLRELVPEIYTLPEMFINQNNYEYGTTQEKVVVDNVILPKWADKNPYKFVSQIRKQLQSKYVSETIHHWIDLVYGYKQRGKDAIQHMNIFYPLTYQNSIDLDKVQEWEEKQSFETQIAHFGQNPAQVIGNNPHPKRLEGKAQWEDKLVADGKELVIQKCFLSKAPLSQEKFLFQSVFEGRNAILAIKFVSQELFFVLRKHEYYLFQILNEKTNFLSRQIQVGYELQSVNASLNYKQLTTKVPVVALGPDIMLVGGFYHGNTQILFLKETKYNRIFRFPASTITALAYHEQFNHLFIGDSGGYLHIYKVTILSKQIEFASVKNIKAHDCRINDLVVTEKANLVTSCSEDGTLSLFNCYSGEIIRTIRHPSGHPINLAQITTSPLYSVVFYSKDNSTVYVYSINGQLLDHFCQKTGFVYNMAILRSTDSTESLVYLNGLRELYIWDLPFMQLKRKVKVKRDDFRISCFECCFNSKIAVAGTQDGALQLVANPRSY